MFSPWSQGRVVSTYIALSAPSLPSGDGQRSSQSRGCHILTVGEPLKSSLAGLMECQMTGPVSNKFVG